MNVSITTYNILADTYVKKKLYPFSDHHDLEPKRRIKLLKSTIQAIDSQVFWLQEVEPSTGQSIHQCLGAKYQAHYVQKHNKPEGSMILVREDISVISTNEIRFHNIRTGKNQVAALAILENAGTRFGVASTHLQWMNDSTSPDQHLGRLQLIELIQATQDKNNIPWILCGDFNANSQSPVIDEARNQGFALSCQNQRPWDTININQRRRKIDYLLYPKEACHPNPRRLPRLESTEPMPSAIHASDHLPLTVDFEF